MTNSYDSVEAIAARRANEAGITQTKLLQSHFTHAEAELFATAVREGKITSMDVERVVNYVDGDVQRAALVTTKLSELSAAGGELSTATVQEFMQPLIAEKLEKQPAAGGTDPQQVAAQVPFGHQPIVGAPAM